VARQALPMKPITREDTQEKFFLQDEISRDISHNEFNAAWPPRPSEKTADAKTK
jgi:hypothetical protein